MVMFDRILEYKNQDTMEQYSDMRLSCVTNRLVNELLLRYC
jgi:hypothetical protein